MDTYKEKRRKIQRMDMKFVIRIEEKQEGIELEMNILEKELQFKICEQS
jgi:hypothetical protein